MPAGYFDSDNVEFVAMKVVNAVRERIGKSVRLSMHDVRMAMRWLLEKLPEPVPVLNKKTIDRLVSEIVVYFKERQKHLRWEDGEVHARSLYNEVDGVQQFDPAILKRPNRYGEPQLKPAGANSFYFT